MPDDGFIFERADAVEFSDMQVKHGEVFGFGEYSELYEGHHSGDLRLKLGL